MDKADLYGLILSGFAGTITSILHAVQRGVRHSWRKIGVQFAIGFCAIYPAYLAGEIFELDKNKLLVIGYLAGILGDRVIQEIYRREQDIYTFFVGSRMKKKGEYEVEESGEGGDKVGL